jgi:hypothetical protein
LAEIADLDIRGLDAFADAQEVLRFQISVEEPVPVHVMQAVQ